MPLPPSPDLYKDALAANDFGYRVLLRHLEERVKPGPGMLPFIEDVVRLAFASHPGRFADGALENRVLSEGVNRIDGGGEPRRPAGNGGLPQVLHVATAVYATGGHARVLTKWMQRDRSSDHTLVLTGQTEPIPDFLEQVWRERGAEVIRFDSGASHYDRARDLRQLSQRFHRVVLHQHVYDTIPILAFARPGGCPEALFTHAHFWLCLGPTVADLVINTMPYYQEMSRTCRFARRTALFGGLLGLRPMEWEEIDKADAKRQVGIAPHQPVAMTIAKADYFAPMAGYDFFGTVAKLLDRQPSLHLLVAGVDADHPLVPSSVKTNERLHLLGVVPDPRPYYRAADVSLESFPRSSLGGFYESVVYGEAFPIQIYGPGENVLRAEHPLFRRYAPRQKTEDQYIDYICERIESLADTRGRAAEMRRALVEEDEHFEAWFDPIYRQLDALEHEPRPIPVTECSYDEDNLILAALNSQPTGEWFAKLPPPAAVVAHFRAVCRRFEPPGDALTGLGRHLKRALAR